MNPIVNIENVKIEIDVDDNCNVCCPCFPPIARNRLYKDKEKNSERKIDNISKDLINQKPKG